MTDADGLAARREHVHDAHARWIRERLEDVRRRGSLLVGEHRRRQRAATRN
jgi:hypothetical protein